MIERVNEHIGKDVNSRAFKDSTENDHPIVTISDFRVLKQVNDRKNLEEVI